jgi:UDP-N-acetylmuramoyl-tripeptide--D-alanyl-D-alanine ligase
MDPLPISKIAEYAGATMSGGHSAAVVTRISTDSRTLQPGDLFVAIRGEIFDGHKFVEQAAERGASGALVEQSWNGDVPESFAILRVQDSLTGYQQIAAGYRRALPLKVICITGSNGKTSTKDFVAAALARRFRVTKTEGNFNNHIGLPRTVLEATAQHEVAVWEIGMNHPGEIAPLAAIAQPDVGIITNIGIAHIEFMGSQEAIAQEKGMLAEAIGPDGTLILNADDPFSEGIASRTRAKVVMFAGIRNGSIRAEDIVQSGSGSEFTITERAHRCRAQLPVPGVHMVQNALLAVAAARVFASSLEEAAAGLASAPLTKARLQLREVHGVQFLDDSYNANPDSTKAALRTLAELETDGRRFAVLGHMGELGAQAERGHAEVGEAAAELRLDWLISVGDLASGISAAAQRAGLENTLHVGTPAEAAEFLAERAGAGDLVLIKGSRSARMEQVLEEFARRGAAMEGAAP